MKPKKKIFAKEAPGRAHEYVSSFEKLFLYNLYPGAAEPGGSGGVGPPLEFEIYLVNFLKNRKKKGFFSIGPPLGKNRSSAPDYHNH